MRRARGHPPQSYKAVKAAAQEAAEKELKKLSLDNPDLDLVVEIINVGSDAKVRGPDPARARAWVSGLKLTLLSVARCRQALSTLARTIPTAAALLLSGDEETEKVTYQATVPPVRPMPIARAVRM